MDVLSARSSRYIAACAWLVLIVGLAGGCSALATLEWVITGHNRAAEFEGLKGRKVAVVCRQDGTSVFNRDSDAYQQVGARVTRLLRRNLGKKTKMIPYQKVAQYSDSNQWEEFREVGEYLEADMVVAIELIALNSNGGSTMHQGKADVKISVLDMADEGAIVYEAARSIEFPSIGPMPRGNISEHQFREMFLGYLSGHIARHFYAHDATTDMDNGRSP